MLMNRMADVPGTAATRACSTTPRSTAGTPVPNSGRINASNPCSEYMFLDDYGLQFGQRQL